VTENTQERDRFGKKTERGEAAMTRPTFHDFKKKALSDPDVRAEYESLSAAYHLRKKLIGLRKKAGLTQEELAKRLHTQKSNISRLENVNSKISPKLSTIEEYAKAVGFKLALDFVSQKTSKPHNKALPVEARKLAQMSLSFAS
jgi:DNA-binding XRE family transcriptional regulator